MKPLASPSAHSLLQAAVEGQQAALTHAKTAQRRMKRMTDEQVSAAWRELRAESSALRAEMIAANQQFDFALQCERYENKHSDYDLPMSYPPDPWGRRRRARENAACVTVRFIPVGTP